ncbi:MAG TPA: chemotaxis protein CheW [Spirochaetota bacterium]|nr:chemotaxis protein CheW [Spirochaetota bacterium]HOF33147.1 chemotaxis protein CheW [Spirochaetota bacterium]HOR43409.1 chemotaxis protein CheW [Spirochaetota bacterium]HOU83470.1 chemotaxis protein CheW [Spirochaetota bacterium]HPK56363.1 chemotaxis protein CheW [Spirochaetota bacterium]
MDKDNKEKISLGEENQFVTFMIGSETYGVEVLKVKEILGMTEITHVPNSLSFMRGVINLRGAVVPVVDMRLKFQLQEKEYDTFTVIIIVEVRERLIGMIVDTVSDVASIPVSTIQNTPHFTSKIETDFIKGIGQIESLLVIILDVDKILNHEEFKKIEEDKTA